MRRMLLALLICAIMVTAATSAVSAKGSVKSAIRHYDITDPVYVSEIGKYIYVKIGTITINTETGHYAVNLNFGPEVKYAEDFNKKERLKDDPYPGTIVAFVIFNSDIKPITLYPLGGIALVNDGGNIHGEGTLGSTVDLNTIASWPADAHVLVDYMIPW